MSQAALGDRDHDLLLDLLRLPTAGPLETDEPVRLWAAGHRYASAATELGFTTVRHRPAEEADVRRDDVPLAVRVALDRDPGFLTTQPSLVLRLGPELPRASTVMFNVHLDTVAGLEPVGFDGTRFHGRGAIDAKGPAVALLAGIRAAQRIEPALGREIGILVQAVAGEEGGAMGTFGTRPLVEAGYVGRLNVFCEPTGLRYLQRSTAAMTACVRVEGADAIDDRPEAGHNATVLLGFLAQHLGLALAGHSADGRACVAGLHTGHLHNRVYGTGSLLLNLSYASAAAGRALAARTESAFAAGVDAFTARFAGTREFGRTAADAATVTTLQWHKRGLPVLAGADPWCAALLADAGIEPWPADEAAFTCDAIWLADVADTATVVLGPGSLAANNAHARGEFADVADLDGFADAVARLLVRFARTEGNRP